MRGKAELGGRDSIGVEPNAGASPVSNRKAKACSGRAPHRAPSCRRAGRGSGDYRGTAASPPAGTSEARDPRPAPPRGRRPPRAAPWPGPAAQSARRRGAAAVPLAAAEPTRAGGASRRSPPGARPRGSNALSGWLSAERRPLAQRLEGRGLRLAGQRGSRGDWPGRGR